MKENNWLALMAINNAVGIAAAVVVVVVLLVVAIVFRR